MKRILIFLTILFIIKDLSFSQWQVQLDLQNAMWLDRIQFIDQNKGWAIGGFGTSGPYLYTEDGGLNWYLCDDWLDIEGYDIFFVNQNTGFISSTNGSILKSINGGQTWESIQTPVSQSIYRLFFTDENNGWAIISPSEHAQILHTENGGSDWLIQQVFNESSYGQINSLFFLNDSVGWASGGDDVNSKIKKTIDKGETWDIQYSIPGFTNLGYIFFTDSLNGWACLYDNASFNYIQTIDGGQTWEPKLLSFYNINNLTLLSIKFINESVGWITGFDENDEGYIFLTTDGGQNWNVQYRNYDLYRHIIEISAVDENHAWAVGDNFIYYNDNADTITSDIEDLSSNIYSFIVSPNPSNGVFAISINNFNYITDITITDITGKEVLNTRLTNPVSEIDISNQPNGVYLLTVRNQIQNSTQKVILYNSFCTQFFQ